MAGEAEAPPPEETLSFWKREQARLKALVVVGDTEAWQRDAALSGLRRVGGVDVSFVKGDGVRACASLVVLSYPELEVTPRGARRARVRLRGFPERVGTERSRSGGGFAT